MQGDTTKTIDALLQMLRIAPTNAPLRDLVFKKLLAYGRPELAEGVADEGLKLDPGNPDLYDLRANARDLPGELQRRPGRPRADRPARLQPGGQHVLREVPGHRHREQQAGLPRGSSGVPRGRVRKFPDNTTLLKQSTGAYAMVGRSDSLFPGSQSLVVK